VLPPCSRGYRTRRDTARTSTSTARPAISLQAELALRTAASVDLGDYFRFELGPARPLEQETNATRVPVTAYLGPTEFASFHADLVASLSMTGRPTRCAR